MQGRVCRGLAGHAYHILDIWLEICVEPVLSRDSATFIILVHLIDPLMCTTLYFYIDLMPDFVGIAFGSDNLDAGRH
jgi:hypothetical protein